LTEDIVKRKARGGARAGTQTLTLLATPINVFVLQALATQPRSLIELRREAGSPAATTMRDQLRTLTDTGVLTRHHQNGLPGALDYELTSSGRELLLVVDVLRTWLAEAPEESLALGAPAAKSAIKALVEGWGTSMLRALAARPLTLTELDRLIVDLSYPSLDRRLGAMRLAGQIKACPSSAPGTPYTVTDWLRRAVGPLAAAARWEGTHVPEHAAAIAQIDAEAAFLLAIPLIDDLEPELSGACRLAVEVRSGEKARLAGVLVTVVEGRIVSCATRHQGETDAWASGSASAWLRAVIEHAPDRLEMGGDCGLAHGLLDGLHGVLFRDRRPRQGHARSK
jgi:DNA-binding HxlR family transcriptional regulator